MKDLLRIVHVEDSKQDSELVQELLLDDGLSCELKRVETREELIDCLSRGEYDLVLSDCTLPQFSGYEALEITSELKPQVPFVFFSGTIGEEAAIESLRNGASDYVLKNNVHQLVHSVRRALAETEDRATRRAVERRLSQARRLQAVTTLAGSVARDVDRLLANIRGHASSLSTECRHSQRALEIIRMLEQTADEGSTLMHQLLAFARRSKARFSGLEMKPFLKGAAVEMKKIMPREIKLTLQLEPDLPRIFADAELLLRMITNLVLNARDALPKGGRIMLSTAIVRFDPVPAHAPEIETAPYLALRVADNGIGMEESTRLRIFEPFFTTKPLGQGAGLGLSEVFGLMRIHNGLIDVESVKGRGTIVSLYLPLPRSSHVAPERVVRVSPVLIPEVAAPL
jgi:signal transduction histidine kinase